MVVIYITIVCLWICHIKYDKHFEVSYMQIKPPGGPEVAYYGAKMGCQDPDGYSG
jgi:hypothetical protein